MIAVTGRAGHGKSHLVRQLLERVAGTGIEVSVGRCHELATEPYGPLLGLLRQIAGRDDAGALSPLFEPVLESAATKDHLVPVVVDAILECARTTPIVVVVEDAQWADSSTLAVLEHLCDRIEYAVERLAVLVVVTVRDGAGPQQRRVVESIDAMTRGAVHDLVPMTEVETNDLLRSSLRARPSVRLLQLVQDLGCGVPLHALTIVAALGDRRELRVDQGAVDVEIEAGELAGLSDLSAHLDDVIDSCPAPVYDVLAALAVFGTEMALGDLAAVAETDETSVRAAIEHGARHGITEVRLGYAAYTHATHRTGVYLSLPGPARHRLHARCCDLLEQSAGDHEVRIATHASHASASIESRRRFDLVRRGGERAYSLGSWLEAERLLESAVATGEALQLPERMLAELRLRAGHAAYRMLDSRGALRHLDAAAERARAVGDHQTWAKAVLAAVRYVDTIDMRAPARTPGIDQLDELLSTAELDDATLGELHGLYAEVLTSAGRADEAAAHVDQAIHHARVAGDPRTLGRTLFAAGVSSLLTLDLEAARRSLTEAGDHADACGDQQVVLWVPIRLGLLELVAGDLDASLRHLNHAAELVWRQRNWAEGSFAAAISLGAKLARGDVVGFEADAAHVESFFQRADYMFTPPLLFPTLARHRSLRGDLAGANAALDAWEATGQQAGWLARAQAALTSGHEPPMRDPSEPEPAWSPSGRNLLGLNFTVATAAVAVPLGRHDLCDGLLQDVDDALAAGARFTAAGGHSLARLRGGLLATLGRRAEAIQEYARAIVEDGRSGAELEVALARVELARLLSGDKEQSVECVRLLERAEETTAALELHAVAAEIDRIRATQGFASVRSAPAEVAHRAHDYRAVMFTDVVGSTDIGVRYGDDVYLRVVRRHDDVVRRRLAEFGGFLFDTAGDGALSWFADPNSALRCATGILADVARLATEPGEPRLELCVGLADGTPIEHGGDLFGTAVNLAARVLSEAAAGECLVTSDLRSRVAVSTVEFDDVGAFDLKGFPDPVSLYRARGTATDRAEPAGRVDVNDVNDVNERTTP